MKLEEFRAYAKVSNVIPVSRRLLADGETPLGVYRKLAKSAQNTFLLESAEHGGAWSRYSFIDQVQSVCENRFDPPYGMRLQFA